MIFCGDIALPFKESVRFLNLPKPICKQVWIGNLEGSLIKDEDIKERDLLSRRIVFNSYNALDSLLTEISYKAFSLANNHILDAAPITTTLQNLNDFGMYYFGAGVDIEDASRELLIKDGNRNYVIVSSGWDLIKCVYAKGDNGEGVNPYNPKSLINNAKTLIDRYPNGRVIYFMHWNYELEQYPQPMDRDFAHQLIDIGVYAVIGCHAHRVQPIEIYKGQPIVYGLGNFAFRQCVFMNGQLNFPEFSYPEIAFEIKDDDSFVVHHFLYEVGNHTVRYIKSETISISNAPFEKFPSKEYSEWFKTNRYQRKALPTFYLNENALMSFLKRQFVKLRLKGVDFLVKNKRVFYSVKTLMKYMYE